MAQVNYNQNTKRKRNINPSFYFKVLFILFITYLV